MDAQKGGSLQEPARKSKNPWVAAILNFFVPGLGYLYVGTRRTFFKVGLVIATLVTYVSFLFGGATGSQSPGLADFAGLAAGVLFLVLLAADAYKDAQEAGGTR